MNPARRHPARARHAGFSLTELLVAVGAVALLTVGVGQIFRSVGRLTSTGVAVAEVDGLARAVERRLREDLASFARLPEDESFLVIRMREVGDLNRNRTTDNDEALGPSRAPINGLYLSAEDADTDRRLGLNPYEIVPVGAAPADASAASRAVTTRIDEMAFLAMAPLDRPFVSAQVSGDSGPVTASVARIYYGHSLRPQIGPRQTNDPPERQWIADGLLQGEPLGAAFGAAGTNTPGRNRFAADWVLARQPLLLVGGTAAGSNGPLGQNFAETSIGVDREFAPYVRDLSSSFRFSLPADPQPSNFPADRPTAADPHLIRYGRTDIAAQTAADVRRWIEGDTRLPASGAPRPYVGAFSSGFFVGPLDDGRDSSTENFRLWERDVPTDPSDDTYLILQENTSFLRSALAGVLQRFLAESEPPPIDRSPTGTSQPEDGLMDLHAALAGRCSRFEIAWASGARARVPIDVTGDGVDDYQPGDLIWFDISPIFDNSGQIVAHSTYDQWFTGYVQRQLGITNPDQAVDGFGQYADSRLGGTLQSPSADPRPEVPAGRYISDDGDADASGGRLLPIASNNERAYDPEFTGGHPGPSLAERDEALAVWGFRVPTSAGDFQRPWPKPRFLRVRVTLHDAQNRLPDGKTYTFVLALRPEEG